MAILHQAIHGIAHHGRSIAFVGQLGIGIRRGAMRLIRAPLPAKRDGGIP